MDKEEIDAYEDPDLVQDKLPQPYRMLDKLVNYIFDNAWKIIVSLENTKLQNEAMPKFTEYEISDLIENYTNVNCCDCKSDTDCVILGLTNGLSVLQLSNTHDVIASLKDETLNIKYIKIIAHENDCLYFYAINNQGYILFYGLYKNKIYLLYSHSEVNSKFIKKAKISPFNEYIGFIIDDKNSLSSKYHIEIYSLPIEKWYFELLNISNDEDFGIDFKFSPLILINQISYPKEYMGEPSNNVIINKYEDTAILQKIGLGTNHCISAQHIEERKRIFSLIHERHIGLINQGNTYIHKNKINYCVKLDPVVTNYIPQFKFLTHWKYSNHSTQIKTPVLAVAWPNFRFLIFYDIITYTEEDLSIKNDTLIWPLANIVKTFKASHCSNFVAFVTQNNTVTIYNRKYDFPYGCVGFNSDILQLHFVDKYIGNKLTMMDLNCDNVSLLVQCDNGQIFIIVMNIEGLICDPICVYFKTIGLETTPYILKFIPGLPDVVLIIFCDGPILVHSLVEKRTLCQLAIPEFYKLASSNFTIFGSTKISLMAIYTQIENLSTNKNEQKAFIYKISSYNELKDCKVLISPEIKITINSLEAVSDGIIKQILLSEKEINQKFISSWDRLKRVDFKNCVK